MLLKSPIKGLEQDSQNHRKVPVLNDRTVIKPQAHLSTQVSKTGEQSEVHHGAIYSLVYTQQTNHM